ncbi:hypothetical protein WJX77_010270 [Trebouxia sp. C0004]
MSEDTTLTPTTLRALSVPGTPGFGPAAPLKQRFCAARSHPPTTALKQLAAEVPQPTEPLNLSSAFDAVATNFDACLDTASSVVSSLGQNDTDGNRSNSLTLPLCQAPVTPDALPKASVSVRANAMRKLDDQPDAAPADELFCESPKAASGKSVTTDAAEICPPSPPQSRPVKDSVPSKETVLGMFKGATFPHDESERLRTVALLGILDQPDDPVLTSITKLVTRLLKVSTAGINIIDRDRLWWPSISTSSTLPSHGWAHPRNVGFCSYTLLSEAAEVLVVEDAQKDARFKDSPFVTGFPNIRFYGGAPLIASNGHRIGALCAIDSQPRSLSSQQLAVLAHLAEMVVRRIERDKQILLQQHSKTALLRSLRNQQEAVLLCDTAMHGWPILFTNKSCNDMLGWDEGTLGGRGVWDIFKMGAGSKEAAEKALAERARFSITASATKFPTHARQLQLEFRPANTPTAIHPSLQIGIPAFIADREDIFQLYFVTVTPVAQVTTAPGKMQASMRPQSAGVSGMRPSDAWAHNKTAPAYSSFPSDIRHIRTQQNLVENNCEIPSLQHSQFEEVQLGMLLGGSSSGNVYRGMWRSIPVAVKKTRARLVDCVPKGEKDSLITQEAAAAMGASHPHLVTTYKYAIKYYDKGAVQADAQVQEEGKPLLPGTCECWLFMEMCNKGTLQHAMDNGWLVDKVGKPNLVALLSSAHEASLGLAQLHRGDVIHGGLSPACCFLKAARNQRGFVVKVGDLGRSSTGRLGTRIDVRRGLRFQSPETICSGVTSKEGDAYAFGVMLYELYCSKPAWADLSTGEIISAKLRSHAGVSLQLVPAAPLALQDLIDRCLCSNPVVRPTLDDIQEALLLIRDRITSPSSSPVQIPTPPQQVSPQQAAPLPTPIAPQPCSEVRQAVSRSRINATQYQQPVRRQHALALNGTQQPVTRQSLALARQMSNPQRTGSQADRIPADWGKMAKLESNKSARLGTEAAATEAAIASSPVPNPAPSTTADSAVTTQEMSHETSGNATQTQRSESAKAPCYKQVWRTVGLCAMARTTSFMPEQGGVNSGSGIQPVVAASERPAASESVNAGSKQGNPKMSLRVKKLFSTQSKQIRQCMALD